MGSILDSLKLAPAQVAATPEARQEAKEEALKRAGKTFELMAAKGLTSGLMTQEIRELHPEDQVGTIYARSVRDARRVLYGKEDGAYEAGATGGRDGMIREQPDVAAIHANLAANGQMASELDSTRVTQQLLSEHSRVVLSELSNKFPAAELPSLTR